MLIGSLDCLPFLSGMYVDANVVAVLLVFSIHSDESLLVVRFVFFLFFLLLVVWIYLASFNLFNLFNLFNRTTNFYC